MIQGLGYLVSNELAEEYSVRVWDEHFRSSHTQLIGEDKVRKFILLVCITACLTSCTCFPSISTEKPTQNSAQPPHKETSKAYQVAIDVLHSIDAQDFKTLSKYIHPEKGVIFVPFSFVDYDECISFSKEQVENFGADNTIYNWGTHDASPNAIELTAQDYFKAFVYDKKYLQTKQVAIDDIIRQGNSIENVMEVFPDCTFVEFYDEGSKDNDGLDWSSLKVVMVQFEDDFRVVAFVHSSYTL